MITFLSYVLAVVVGMALAALYIGLIRPVKLGNSLPEDVETICEAQRRIAALGKENTILRMRISELNHDMKVLRTLLLPLEESTS